MDAGLSIEGGAEAGVCFGGGAHAETVEGQGTLGVHIEHDSMQTAAESDSVHSHETRVTWSYSTSNSPEYAGQFSDSFLLNTLVIIFRETRTILFDETTCTASEESPRHVTFDVGSPKNRRPLSFVSYFQVVNEIQPQLDRVLASRIAERNGELSEAESPTQSPDELLGQITILEAGANAWRSILADYENTHAMARNGELPSIKDFFNVRKARKPVCHVRKYEVVLNAVQLRQILHRKRINSIGVSSILPFASDGELEDVNTGRPSYP